MICQTYYIDFCFFSSRRLMGCLHGNAQPEEEIPLKMLHIYLTWGIFGSIQLSPKQYNRANGKKPCGRPWGQTLLHIFKKHE